MYIKTVIHTNINDVINIISGIEHASISAEWTLDFSFFFCFLATLWASFFVYLGLTEYSCERLMLTFQKYDSNQLNKALTVRADYLV